MRSLNLLRRTAVYQNRAVVSATSTSQYLSVSQNSTRETTYYSRNPQQRQQRFLSTALRRKRKKYERHIDPLMGTRFPTLGGMEEPLEYSGDTLDEYTEKASLSPWTPVPDSVARKIFDRAEPTQDDIHVELGSGDGRVNFFAIQAGVKRSVGIDVDEDIVQVANDRLNRIHPKPSLEFIVADLMDPDHPAWAEIEQATILTMYFAKEGLEKIRPLIENALRRKRCKIFTCGYPMPGWESQVEETVLDMPIHFYDWGNADVDNAMLTDYIIPEDMMPSQGMDKFGKSKNSNFKPDPLKGFHPDDLIDYGWDDFESPKEEVENK